MTYNEIANVYRQESAHGNHPVELVGKLYEAILEDFRRAIKAANAGDVQARTVSLNHALQIIAELQSVLDHERGGEVSSRLDGFYNVTRSLLVEANVQGKPQNIQRLVDLYLPVRQAWKKVEQEASAGTLNIASPGQHRTDQEVLSSDLTSKMSPKTPQTQWSA